MASRKLNSNGSYFIKKLEISLLSLCVFGLLASTNLGWAKSKTTTSKHQEPPTLHIQDFEDGPISVQFRYVNGSLTYIRFMNTSDNPIKLNVLEKNYVLGPKDALVINPPKVEYLKVKHEPYIETTGTTAAQQVLPERFQKESLYHLPKTADDKTGQ